MGRSTKTFESPALKQWLLLLTGDTPPQGASINLWGGEPLMRSTTGKV